ncbi:MAG: hypothetical protein HY841_00860 [Bacteroidetes bacterium]|nr:hypothetical protein [Bacteroidota bacterium]
MTTKVSLKEKAIVSYFTLISSLTGFYYAKSKEKEVMPYVMVGGFIGALIGEAIAHSFCNEGYEKQPGNKSLNPKSK